MTLESARQATAVQLAQAEATLVNAKAGVRSAKRAYREAVTPAGRAAARSLTIQAVVVESEARTALQVAYARGVALRTDPAAEATAREQEAAEGERRLMTIPDQQPAAAREGRGAAVTLGLVWLITSVVSSLLLILLLAWDERGVRRQGHARE